MIPSRCVLCGKAYRDEIPPNEGDYVEFADYREPEPHSIGGPDGMEYFCDEHLAIARSLVSLPMKEALVEMKNRFGPFPQYQRKKPRPGWLKRIFSFGKHSWAP